jgi:hypothetical protein
VSGGDPPPADSDRTSVSWGSPQVSHSAQVSGGSWFLDFSWPGLDGITGNVHALQWTPTSGIPTSYRGYGVATAVGLASGGTETGIPIAMTAPDAGTIAEA